MALRIIRTVAVAFMALTGSVHAQQPPPRADDLGSVVTVVTNPAATTDQKQRLVGKVYSGVVSVVAVRLSKTDGGVVVDAVPAGPTADPGKTAIGLRFIGSADDLALQQLRKNQSVRVRGTLKDFSTTGSTNWANFTDLVVEGPGR